MAGSARRGPRADADDLRGRILDAALREFSERGYRDATMRAIAREAGVNPKLVHYYFGTKEQLFTTSVGGVFQPERLAAMIGGGGGGGGGGVPGPGMGARMVRMVLSLVDDPTTGAPFLSIVRNVGTHEESRKVFLRFVTSEIIGKVAPVLPGPSAELRISLVGSQMLGLVTARYVVEVPALVEPSVAELAELIGPTVDRYLFGDLP